MTAKLDLVALCDAFERSSVSDQMKAWWRAMRARVAGPSLGSIFGL
ncbi:hypothetical protein [Aureimonas ureilytica]|nr:hypothetical protein [Aureimonas ureilytica]